MKERFESDPFDVQLWEFEEIDEEHIMHQSLTEQERRYMNNIDNTDKPASGSK